MKQSNSIKEQFQLSRAAQNYIQNNVELKQSNDLLENLNLELKNQLKAYKEEIVNLTKNSEERITQMGEQLSEKEQQILDFKQASQSQSKQEDVKMANEEKETKVESTAESVHKSDYKSLLKSHTILANQSSNQLESWYQLTSQMAQLFKLYSETDKKTTEIEKVQQLVETLTNLQKELQAKIDEDSKVQKDYQALIDKYNKLGQVARDWKSKYDAILAS